MIIERRNIEFNEEQWDSPQFQEYFNIAAQNLHDFNRRTNLNIRLRYDEKEAQFNRIADSPYNHLYDEYVFINWFITMYNNPQFVDDWIDNLYVERLETNFQHRRTLYHPRHEAQLFLSVFKDYSPIGFLSEENEMKLRQKIEEFNAVVASYL